MSIVRQAGIHHASEGGVIGEHPPANPFQILAGPATESQLNTARLPLVAIFCWKVEDIRFAFDSSFVTHTPDPATNPSDSTSDPRARAFDGQDIRSELTALAKLVIANPGCPLSVFGHADPVGPAVDPDGYNKALSGRRAAVIYALLIFNQDKGKAEHLWNQVAATENWGADQRKTMEAATNLPAGTPMRTLISGYLPKLCPPELNIGPKDFLAQGADPSGKGDYQGCSSFNPLLIFSQDEEDDFEAGAAGQDQTVINERNLANAPNRRVMVLMFRKGSKVDPSKWPCPSADGGKSGCIKRFWSNGQSRRTLRLPHEDRKYSKTKDTFACRFYDRLTSTSPCERAFWIVRLLEAGSGPLKERLPIAHQPFTVTGVGGGTGEIHGITDANGVLRIQVHDNPAIMTLKIAGLQLILEGGGLKKIGAGELAIEQRLTNLGFFDTDSIQETTDKTSESPTSLSSALTEFQKSNSLPETNGKIDAATRRSVRHFHGS